MNIKKLSEFPELRAEIPDIYWNYLHNSGDPDYVCGMNPQEISDHVDCIIQKGREFFVSLDADGNCIGFTCGEDVWECEGVSLYETMWVYVAPSFRRMWIAYNLKVAQILDVQKRGAIDWIYSKIHQSNTASIELHQSLGFNLFPDENSAWYMAWLKLRDNT